MQLRDVIQSQILPKYTVLAITLVILAHFSSNWAQNVRIFRVYHVGNRLQSVSNGPVASFQKQATGTGSPVLNGPVMCLHEPDSQTLFTEEPVLISA